MLHSVRFNKKQDVILFYTQWESMIAGLSKRPPDSELRWHLVCQLESLGATHSFNQHWWQW